MISLLISQKNHTNVVMCAILYGESKNQKIFIYIPIEC